MFALSSKVAGWKCSILLYRFLLFFVIQQNTQILLAFDVTLRKNMVSGEGMGRVVFAFTKSWTQILLQSTVLGMSNYLNSPNYAVHCQRWPSYFWFAIIACLNNMTLCQMVFLFDICVGFVENASNFTCQECFAACNNRDLSRVECCGIGWCEVWRRWRKRLRWFDLGNLS